MFSELVDPYLTAEALSKAFIIFIVWIVLVVSACLCIRTIWAREELQDAVGSYLLALSFSDLVYGFTIVPMAFYSSLTPDWNFYGDNSLTCKVAGYLQIVLFSFNFYIFAWIAVNRYTALYRPSRYDAEQTKTRSKCWIAFSLITSSFMACPIVIANMEVAYFSEAELCVLRWSKTKTLAYNCTLTTLILGPTCSAIFYSLFKIISAMWKSHQLEDNQRTILETDHNFIQYFFMLFSFTVSFMPLVIILIIPYFTFYQPEDLQNTTFIFVYLATASPASKLLIYLFINPEFRKSFTRSYTWCCCMKPESDRFEELVQYENPPSLYRQYL